MIFENLENIDSEKIAIISEGKKYSYGEILRIIKSKAGFFKEKSETFLLCHSNDFDNFLNLLAIMAVGKRAVFGGKGLTPELKIAYEERFDLKVFDTETIEKEPIKEFYKPQWNEQFLGVLSSGSSGHPKIIWKDFEAWFSAFPHQSTIFGTSQNDTVFVLNALAYSANLNTALHTFWMGATLVFGKLSEASVWSLQWDEHEVTSAFLVPSHLRLLLANKNIKGQKIKSIVSAGEKLDAKIAKVILQKFPNVRLTEYYGAAELGHISFAQNQEIVNNPTSVGKAFPGVEIEIKEGKICVKSKYISPDYRANPTVSDYGFIDENENLFVLGREGRMFNRRGLNIFAEEIENAALLHPMVLEAVALAGKRSTESIDLYVIVRSEIPKSELRSFLLKLISKQKLPNRIVYCLALPRTDSGKINYKLLAKKPTEEEALMA